MIRATSPHEPAVAALLDEHLAEMHATSPPESVHALPHDALAAPGVHLVAAWSDEEPATLLGIGALRRHDGGLGELKAMRTTAAARGRGVGAAVLDHLLAVARAERLREVALETGAEDHFAPARRLYARRGFVERGPFAGYRPDPLSVFMTLTLD
jgi:putative acetyltransferase